MKIQNKISIDRMARDRKIEFEFDQNEKFVSEVLNELNEGHKLSEYTLSEDRPGLEVSGSIIKKANDKYGEFMILEGHISCRFLTLCVGSGVVMLDRVETSIHAVVIDEELETRFGHEEDTTLFINDSEYDLYYFNKQGETTLKEIVSEYIFLNKDPYPKIANFKGINSAL